MAKRDRNDAARPPAPLSDALTLLPGVPVPPGSLPAPPSAPAATPVAVAAPAPQAAPVLPPPSSAPVVPVPAPPAPVPPPAGQPLLAPPSTPVVLTAELLAHDPMASPAHKAPSGSPRRLIALVIGAVVLAAAGAYYVLVLMPSMG